jgi:acetyl esterase
VSDPVALQAAYAAAGVASTLLLLPGTRHAEGYFDDAIEPTLTFLRAALA